MNNTFICESYGKTLKSIDELGCRIINFAAFLYYYDFGYICMGPIFVVIAASIFGKIQGSYRWLLLYQALWDLFGSSFYSCGNLLVNWVKTVPQCFYLARTYVVPGPFWMSCLDGFITHAIMYNSYSALLLLSISRFMTLYNPLAYKKLFQGRKVLITIIIFTFFAFLFDLNTLILYLRMTRYYQCIDECMLLQNLSLANCNKLGDFNSDTWYKFLLLMYSLTSMAQHSKPPLFLLLSSFAAILTFWKIAKQAKFQSQHNRKDFANSLRIAIVMGLQIGLNCFVVFFEIIGNFLYQLVSLFQLKIITTRSFVVGRNYTEYWDLRFPQWMDGPYGLSSDNCRRMIIQFRILVECLIILIILTEYREAITKFVKFTYRLIRHPWIYYQNFNQTAVSKFSQN